MDRLIVKNMYGELVPLNDLVSQYEEDCWNEDCRKKLYEYEQLEEDGLLLRFPCKIGETVYWIGKTRIIECKVCDFEVIRINRMEDETGNRIPGVFDIVLNCTCTLDGIEGAWVRFSCKNELGRKVFFNKEDAEDAAEK